MRTTYMSGVLDPEKVMSFIDAHDFSVGLVLRVLGIPASTYYDWRAQRASPSPRRRGDAELLALIVEIRGGHEFAATYGSPRVWLELRRRGVRVGRKRVERIMREIGLRGASAKYALAARSPRAHPASSAVGVNASVSSRAETTRLNRGYAVRSIDATRTPSTRTT
ncbi:hypothetical protein EEB14_52295 [Rhodococcus sp. WS4]|nr:hypothetical protein EEB14_52295 [Rhodococcus sp. WS4]